jgi:hypothetical protein
MLLAGVVLSSNLHLPLVQGVAWARMYSHYREGYAPLEALEITFSGKVPCALCEFVQKAQKEQQVLDGSMADTFKLLLPFSPVLMNLPVPRAVNWRSMETWLRPAFLRLAPETPPPRGA